MAGADVVTLTPVADNTLFLNVSSPTQLLSSGAGDGVYSGRTAFHADIQHRGLVRFDVSGIPCGSVILSTELTMSVDRSPRLQPDTPIGLHRVLGPWGEGATNSFGGLGEPSQVGDTNWRERVHPGQMWTNPGGDFVAAESATALVSSEPLPVTWESTPGLCADVSAWVNSPLTSFGWLLLNDEANTATVRKFASREHGIAANRPSLRVEFVPAAALQLTAHPMPATACGGEAATFSVSAVGPAPMTYVWQIETGPGVWVNLTSSGSTFACGGGSGSGLARAVPDNSPVVAIEVVACAGVGEYSVRCVVTSPCGGVTSNPAILTLGGPSCCAVDFNVDGVLSPDDLDEFITTYFSEPPDNATADYNADGIVSPDDLDEFITSYFEGC